MASSYSITDSPKHSSHSVKVVYKRSKKCSPSTWFLMVWLDLGINFGLLQELIAFQQSSNSFISCNWAFNKNWITEFKVLSLAGTWSTISYTISSISSNNLPRRTILFLCLFHSLMKTKGPEKACTWKEGPSSSPLPCQGSTSWAKPKSFLGKYRMSYCT